MRVPRKAVLGAALLGITCGQALEPRISLPPESVGRYERLEFEIAAPTDYANPFDPGEVTLDLAVTDPKGLRFSFPAFIYQPFERRGLPESGGSVTWWYPAGAVRWAARFAPTELGQYQVRAVLTDQRGVARSEVVAFECVPSDRRGYLRVSTVDPRFFATSDGAPFFPVGQNLAFIGEGQFMNLVRTEETLGRLAANGANYVRVWAGCHDWAMGIEARKSAFGRSWNWQPPFAPHPDDPERQCVRLQGQAGTSIRVEPSHRVALRPETRYRLSGRVRTLDGATFEVVSGKRRVEPAVRSGTTDWTPWQLEFTTGAGEYWLSETTLRLAAAGRAWVDSLSLTELDGGPELLWEADPDRPARGRYNQPDCFLLDEVLTAAERHGILIQLTLFTRDLYLGDLADDTSEAYDHAIDDARKLLRYAVARWGYSTSLAVWEYFNEMDPGRPTTRFYRELGEWLDRIDPYRHLRSTSTWHPSPRDWKLPYLDFADEHFYLRPGDYERLRDEVDAVLDRVALLRRHAPNRPVLLGEFGLANEQWQPTEAMRRRPEITDFHNVLWASALSGASGTALFWWWDRLDPRNHYPHYLPLTQFASQIPWTTSGLRAARAAVHTGATESPPTAPSADVVVIGLAGRDRAHLWLFHTQASWHESVIAGKTPETLTSRRLRVSGLEDGCYQVQWWHTREGKVIEETRQASANGLLQVPIPAFDRYVACHIVRP
jgi:hypothetical protein